MIDGLLAEQADRLRRSAFYRARLGDNELRTAEDLRRLPFLTKEELRADQRARPPFGDHLCADPRDLVRMHVTSGTTGEPVAIGLTARDHLANSAIGGEAFRIAGLRPDDLVAHCLNYALYAGGVADHMALEASGATVVPVGVGQSRRLRELIPALGITAIFGTLSFPAYLAQRVREAGVEPRDLGLRHIVTAGEPGAGLAAVRREVERSWDVTVADTFGMSDVWSTMGGECGHGEGLHLTCLGHAVMELVDPGTGDPVELGDGATGECGPTCSARRRRCCATGRPTSRASGRRRARAGARRRGSGSRGASTTCCASRPSTCTPRPSATSSARSAAGAWS